MKAVQIDGYGGVEAAASAATLAELAEAIAAGDLAVPIQRTYRLTRFEPR
jgi:hypothetical protein